MESYTNHIEFTLRGAQTLDKKLSKSWKFPLYLEHWNNAQLVRLCFAEKNKTFIVGWLVCCFICHSVCVVLHLQGLQTAFGITADMSCKLVQNFLGIAAVNYSGASKWGNEKCIICVCSRLFFPVHFVTCGPIWMTLLWEGFAQTVASFYYYYFITSAVLAEECRKVGIFYRIIVTERRTVVGSVTSHLH